MVWLHGLLVLTSRQVPSAETRPAWRSTRPYLALAGLSLVLALTLESAADVLGLITVADQVPAGLWHGWALALMLDGFLARADDHDLADHHGLGRHLDFGAVANHAGGRRLEVQQLAHGGRGALLDDLLQILTKQDEGDDHRRDAETSK